ncbi:GPP34 family phosphoprotein [Amycolatopsis sp. NBC_00345]|uniref:GOLPH3/VPS74 family protein n=1 Tax=Amycolatopsis sp. NBC_00345 TaxID=2975955 RepID=UPI002E272281
MTLSLPARVYLLACEGDKGRISDRRRVAMLVRAAAVTDLLLRGRLADHGGKASVTGRGPTGDLLLDDVLANLSEDGERSWRSLVRRDGADTLKSLELQLVAAGMLRQHTTRFLGRQVLEVADPASARRERGRAEAALRDPLSEVDTDDAALAALAAAAAVGVTRREAWANSERLAELGERVGPAVPALRHLVRRLRAVRASAGSHG